MHMAGVKVAIIKYNVSDKSLTPLYADSSCAGMDIRSAIDCVVEPNKPISIPTGLRVHIPDGYVGFVRGRSGFCFKHNILAFDGTIDAGYIGEVNVKLFNFGDTSIKVERGERIAQMVLLEVVRGDLQELSDEDFSLINTERGVGGFGHSGVK